MLYLYDDAQIGETKQSFSHILCKISFRSYSEEFKSSLHWSPTIHESVRYHSPYTILLKIVNIRGVTVHTNMTVRYVPRFGTVSVQQGESYFLFL